MILGLDGCVATGKTTLSRAMEKKYGYALVQEYVQPFLKPQDEESATDVEWLIQKHYLQAEQSRALLPRAKDMVLDRTLLSQVAHAMASDRDRRGLAPALAHYLRSSGKRVWGIHPDKFLCLVGDHRSNGQRLYKRELGPFAEGTGAFLADMQYMQSYDDAIRRIGGALPCDRFLMMEACPEPLNVAKAISCPVSTAWFPTNTIEVLVDCLENN